MPRSDEPGNGYRYVGDELDVFALATNWKARLRHRIGPHISGDVLEVGAGLGATTRAMQAAGDVRSWTCLEPDAGLVGRLDRSLVEEPLEVPTRVCVGTLADLDSCDRFDTLLYVDVLEHIEDDRGELVGAAERLRAGGRLVVLAPAHNALYSEFDQAIGHFRRYDRGMLRRIAPAGLVERGSEYLDSAGMVLSLGNRFLLRSGQPSVGQVRFWDRWVVPLSGWIDPMMGRMVGKSVLMVWERRG